MNLFLHWLRWDLRRFRWPLLAWTALLAAFSVWLWHLNAHLLTVDVRLFKYNEVIAAMLGIVELFLLVRILGSDPAAGAKHFWKSRPPAGIAVATSKLIITFVFFLGLPLLCWWLVLIACGFEHEQGRGRNGLTWMEFLWWLGALVIGVLTLAASAARHAGAVAGRLLMGGLVLLALEAGLGAWRMLGGSNISTAPGFHLWTRSIYPPFTDLRVTGVWLAAGSVCFLAARYRRNLGRAFGMAHCFVPALAIIGGSLLSRPSHTRLLFWSSELRLPEPKPHPEPSRFAALQLGQPMLRAGFGFYWDGYSHSAAPAGKLLSGTTTLQIDGLPEDCLAFGKWQTLKIIAPDGREVAMTGAHFPWFYSYNTRRPELYVTGGYMQREALAPLSMMPCRGEGLVRIQIHRRHEKTLPRQPGVSLQFYGGTLQLVEVSPLPRWREPWFQFGVRFTEVFSRASVPVWLKREGDDLRVPLATENNEVQTGYFLNHSRWDWPLRPGERCPFLHAALYAKEAAAGKGDQWHLGVTWYEDEGWIERPVQMDLIVIPRQPGDERTVESLLDGLTLPADASSDEVRRLAKYVLALALVGADGGQSALPLANDPVLQALSRFLAKLPPEHRGVLLRIADEELPPDPDQTAALDDPLRRVLAAVLTPEDIPTLRQKPRLFQYLRSALAERKLIPREETPGPDWPKMTDVELLKQWEQSRKTDALSWTALDYAAQRGLPWVPAAIAEIMELIPHSTEARVTSDFMRKLSDCPSYWEEGIPWLQQNAARLTWDASAKRWKLPPTP